MSVVGDHSSREFSLGAQPRILGSSLALSQGGALLQGAFVVWLLQREYPLFQLLAWYGVVCVLVYGRLRAWRAYWRLEAQLEASPDFGNKRYRRALLIGVICGGIVWGLPGLLFFPTEPTGQLLLALLIATVCASAAISLLGREQYTLLFVALAFTPVGVRLLVASGWSGVELIALLAVNFLPFLSLLLNYRHEANAALSGEKRLRGAEHKLAETAKYTAAIVDHVADGIVINNRHGIVQSFNPAAERMFGYRADEVIGGSFGILLNDEFRANFESFVASPGPWRAREQGRPYEMVARRQNGEEFLAEITVNRFRSDGESLVICVLRDVSELRQTHQQLARAHAELSSLFAATNQVGMIATDLDGTIMRFNGGAEQMLGYTAAEMIGKATPQVFHLASEVEQHGDQLSREQGRTIAGFEVFVWSARENRPERRHWTYVRRDGSHLTVDLMVSGVRDAAGELVGFLGIAVDITREIAARRAEVEARAQLEAFIENAPVAVAMFDTDLQHLSFSRRWQRDYGRGQPLLGRSIYELHSSIEANWGDVFRRCLKGAVEICEEGPVPRPNQGSRWMHWEMRPWYTQEGEIGGVISLVEDIHERKLDELRTLEVNERFELAANASGIGVWEWDWATRQFTWDANMYHIYGLEPGTRINFQEWRRWIHPADVAEIDTRMRKAFDTGEPFDCEVRYVPPNGREIYVRASAAVMRDSQGNIQRLIGIQMDNTRVHEAERLKSEFIATVSHELRTPLTSIRGSLGLVASGVVGELPTRVQQLINIANDNSERLLLLVNDILDVSRIESGRLVMALQHVPILSQVQQALHSNEGFAATCHVALSLHGGDDIAKACVFVDTHRLQQVLSNLLSNALKFSPAGGTVEVVVCQIESAAGARVRIEVRDRGPGISREFSERIFQKFSQADSSDSRAKGGTGLGLVISKALIERLRGEIGFQPRVGGGTIFFIELPVAQLPIAHTDPEVSS